MPNSPKRKTFPVVMQLVPTMHGGGAEQTTVEIARALRERKARHYVVTHQGAMIADLYDAEANVLLIEIGRKSPLKIWRNARRLARLVREHKIDLLHARSRIPAWVAWLVSRWTGVPYLCTCHGRPPANWWKRLYAWPLVRGRAVIANSDWTAKRLQRAYDFPPHKLHVVARGVNVRTFAKRLSARQIEEMRRRWGALPQEQVLLLPARVAPGKGHEFMLTVLRRLVPHTPVRLVCVGDVVSHERLVRRLEGMAQKLTISDKLVFAGASRDMSFVYAGADIVVVPSLKPEPFGRAAIEAQAAGKILLAADHGGLSEIVVRGTGFLLPPGDLDAWEKGLRHALGLSAAARAQLATRARAHAAKHYPLKGMSDATLKIYQSCVACVDK